MSITGQGFAGLELLYSVAAVATSRSRLAAAIERLLEEEGFRPPRSVLALRDAGVWAGGLRQVHAALRGAGALDRWGAAALAEALVLSGPSVELLAVEPPFWGAALEEYAFGGALARAVRGEWRARCWDLATVAPFCVLAGPVVDGVGGAARVGLAADASYEEQMHAGWTGQLIATLAELERGGDATEVLLVPRIASGPVAAGIDRAPELGAAAERAFGVLGALDLGLEAEDGEGAREDAAEVGDAMLAVLVRHLQSKRRGDAAARARIDALAESGALAAHVAAGAADERIEALLAPEILEHYDDASEELVYLALDATFEG